MYLDKIEILKEELHLLLIESDYKISFAESCTGGLVQKSITDISGSSSYFEGGFVTYSNRIKHKILGVSMDTLDNHGAVSSQCALEMALGVNRITDANIAVSITGIAGPTGGTVSKPVGTVWFGFYLGGNISTEKRVFKGDRLEVRNQSLLFVLDELIKFIKKGE
ncbi:MAG: hypothetical protein B6226_01000 [Candidatus Cloacimonetes bacterium 4572_65]|nr:MAG: hypothetical protein B6226_01000 [Candidatus Cloacimonetes bacterium 4572_65]